MAVRVRPVATPGIHTALTAESPATADDSSIYAGKVQIASTQQPDGTFVMLDSSRGLGVETRDANWSGGLDDQDSPLPITTKDVIDANDTWGEATDREWYSVAVDAQYGAQTVYDYLRDVHGIDSIDGRGKKLVSNVHVGGGYPNAYWDRAAETMNYGDGDGKNVGPLVTLDIAGHEIIHGLSQHTANFADDQTASAAMSLGLNEAMSDIIGGAGVEWYAQQKNPQLQGTIDPYRIGEQCFTPDRAGDALRYMDDPRKDGRTLDFYTEEVRNSWNPERAPHDLAGIADNAFYLLTHGGKNRTSGIEVAEPIGMEQGLKIFGRALIRYMTSDGGFEMARQATLQAAVDLYGADSVEARKVGEAWTAVGVTQPYRQLPERGFV